MTEERPEAKQLRMALKMSDINLDAKTAELVYLITKKVGELGENYSIEDATFIESVMKTRWSENDR